MVKTCSKYPLNFSLFNLSPAFSGMMDPSLLSLASCGGVCTWSCSCLASSSSQVNAPEPLTIRHNEEPLLTVNRSEFEHPIPGLPLVNQEKTGIV
jgi:hypothetical protein